MQTLIGTVGWLASPFPCPRRSSNVGTRRLIHVVGVPRPESNLGTRFRKPLLYPLSIRGVAGAGSARLDVLSARDDVAISPLSLPKGSGTTQGLT